MSIQMRMARVWTGPGGKLGRSLSVLVGLGVAGASMGYFVASNHRLAAAMAGGLFGFAVVALKRPSGGGTYRLEATTRWIPWAWLALFFVSNVKLTTARTVDQAILGNASIENEIELATYALIAVMIFGRWWIVSGRWGRAAPFLVWPIVAISSTAWSQIRYFTLLRSAQLFVPIFLGILMGRLWQQAPELTYDLWRRTA